MLKIYCCILLDTSISDFKTLLILGSLNLYYFFLVHNLTRHFHVC